MTLAVASDAGFEPYRRRTRRDEFLQMMDRIIPWAELCAVVQPHYAKGLGGRPPIGLERMLRMLFVQHWFNLADEACEDALYDMPSLCHFVGIDLGRERAPDGTTLLKFRRLLEDKDLGKHLFAKVGEVLQARGMKVGTGTIVDATIIAAPSSTKNADGQRDPEMHQTKKGNQWHFGMKVHVGADSQTGLIHSASVTAANVHDSHEVPNLLHGNETRFYGDSAYRGKAQRERLKAIAPQARDFTNKRAYRNAPLTDSDKETNRRKSSIRAKVEHPFLILKRLWGFAKVRYRGLAKNANRAFALLAAINILKHGKPLTGEVRPA